MGRMKSWVELLLGLCAAASLTIGSLVMGLGIYVFWTLFNDDDALPGQAMMAAALPIGSGLALIGYALIAGFGSEVLGRLRIMQTHSSMTATEIATLARNFARTQLTVEPPMDAPVPSSDFDWEVTYTARGDNQIQRRRVRAASASDARARVESHGVVVLGVEQYP